VLTAIPHGTFKNGFDLVDAAGRGVATFRGSAWRENGEIISGDGRWRFRRDGGRHFTLEGPGGFVAEATKPSMWSGRWQVAIGSETYELAKRTWLSRTFELRGRSTLGEVRPHGGFSSKADVDLPAELSPPLQAFVVAVVLTLWRREQAAAASGAAAAGGATAAGSG
jgi:hypothetical protein